MSLCLPTLIIWCMFPCFYQTEILHVRKAGSISLHVDDANVDKVLSTIQSNLGKECTVTVNRWDSSLEQLGVLYVLITSIAPQQSFVYTCVSGEFESSSQTWQISQWPTAFIQSSATSVTSLCCLSYCLPPYYQLSSTPSLLSYNSKFHLRNHMRKLCSTIKIIALWPCLPDTGYTLHVCTMYAGMSAIQGTRYSHPSWMEEEEAKVTTRLQSWIL